MFNDSLVTVWSAPNYCYRCGNSASIMRVDDAGRTTFKVYDAAVENSTDQRNPALRRLVSAIAIGQEHRSLSEAENGAACPKRIFEPITDCCLLIGNSIIFRLVTGDPYQNTAGNGIPHRSSDSRLGILRSDGHSCTLDRLMHGPWLIVWQ
jgi:hypothetical protein